MKGPARILVVEDDSFIREALVELLSAEGYAVTWASNGAEALARLEADATPSLIVLDLMMPVMDGWEFRSAQRQDPRLSAIPVLVLSASCHREDDTIGQLEAQAFLGKPFDVDAFVAQVARLC